MKSIFVRAIVFLVILMSVISGCSQRAKYERKLKQELATGIRYDSLFLGLYFGMTQKDFYNHCWQLNRQGLVKQGMRNTTVEYQMRDELKYPAIMNFYPGFKDGKIAEMPVKFAYSGWAPWNSSLSADSLQTDLLKRFEETYGDGFMKIDHPKRGSAFIKLNGNRRITIFKENEMYVLVVFTDMSVVKEQNDTSGIVNSPMSAPDVLK